MNTAKTDAMNKKSMQLPLKIKKARECIKIAVALLGERSTCGILPLVEMAAQEFSPYPSEHLFIKNFSCPLPNLEARLDKFRSILAEIGERTQNELDGLQREIGAGKRGKGKPVFQKIESVLHFFLDNADPCSLEDDDNLLVDMRLPAEILQPVLRNGDEFYRLLLQEALPGFNEADLLRVGEIWVDINVISHVGARIGERGQAVLMTSKEVEQLFSSRLCECVEPEYSCMTGLSSEDQEYAHRLCAILDKLDTLERSLAAKNEIKAEEFFRLLDALSEALEYPGHMRKDHRLFMGTLELSPQSVAAKIGSLAKVCAIFEQIAQPIIQEHHMSMEQRLIQKDPFLSDFNATEISNIILWANNGIGAAVPFYSEHAFCRGCMNDGKDWSELKRHGPLCHLAHVLLEDSLIDEAELARAACITMSLQSTRQMFVRINPVNQQIIDGFPARDHEE